MDEGLREPAPAGHPLWDGIYNFAWQIDNLRPFVYVWFAFCLLALLLAGYHALFTFINGLASGGDMAQTGTFIIAVRAGGHIFAGLTALAFLSALYPAACFLNIVEDAAGGNDDVKWESFAWTECIGKLLYLAWVLGCGAALAAIIVQGIHLVVPLATELWLLLVVVLATIFFPVTLLSTLTAASAWVLVEPRLLAAFIRRLHVGAIIYANSAFLAISCLLYGVWTVFDYHLWLTPVTAAVWATGFLTYARVLGRAAWALSVSDDAVAPRRRRRPKDES